MSQASKTKRGISGAANGKSIAFRYNGGGVWPIHLRQVMSMIPGQAQKVGRPHPGSAYDRERGD